MPQLVTIPVSFVELAISYQRPDLKAFNNRAALVEAIFDALLPWNPRVDDIEPLTSGKLSEQGFNFKLPLKQVSFFFGPASCRFTRDNVDWGEAEETIAILNAGLTAFLDSTGVKMAAKTAVVAVHLQPKAGSFMDILSPFAPPKIVAIEKENPKTMASVVKWGRRKITLDGSGALANAAFLRFEREFDTDTTFAEIAHQLLEDERQLFDILGVEEAQA